MLLGVPATGKSLRLAALAGKKNPGQMTGAKSSDYVRPRLG